MREWIAYIIYMNPRLDRLCTKIEKRIEDTALNMDKPAQQCVEEIAALNQIKVRLINLRVMYDALTKRLGKDGLTVFSRNSASNEQFKNLSRSTLCRRRQSAVNKAALALKRLGFDIERMEREYGGLIDNLQMTIDK